MTLIYRDYKEPLKPITDGFGYYGTIAITEDKEQVQCHVCGGLYKSLGMHIKTHGFNGKSYKTHYGLQPATSLNGEGVRIKQIAVTLKYRDTMLKNLAKGQKMDKTGIKQNKWRLERRNKTGTCPDQLLDKIKVVAQELGRTPSHREFARYYHGQYEQSVYFTFGTWNAAVQQAGLRPTKPGGEDKYSKADLIEYQQRFYNRFKRVASNSDYRRGLLPTAKVFLKHWESLNACRMEAGIPIVVPVGWGRPWIETMDYSKYKPRRYA